MLHPGQSHTNPGSQQAAAFAVSAHHTSGCSPARECSRPWTEDPTQPASHTGRPHTALPHSEAWLINCTRRVLPNLAFPDSLPSHLMWPPDLHASYEGCSFQNDLHSIGLGCKALPSSPPTPPHPQSWTTQTFQDHHVYPGIRLQYLDNIPN